MSTTRRGKNEGTITLRSDGRWMARVDMGRDDQGKRQRKTAYGATRAEVAGKLGKLLGQAENGELLTTSTPTLAAWLNQWFATHKADWRPGTQRIYRCAIDQWLIPSLGSTRLEKLRPNQIQQWINAATTNGASTKVVLAHVVLRSAVKWAKKQQLLTYNAAELVKIRRPIRKPVVPLTAEQSLKLIDVCLPHRLGGLVIASLSMGLRIGEVSGVSWADVNLDARELQVRQQVQTNGHGLVIAPLKTAASRRNLTLPVLLVDVLKAQRVRQLEDRMKAGPVWDNAHDLVFTTRAGRPLNPNVIRKAFKGLLAAAGLDPMRFHGLRHSAATLLLEDGATLFDISRMLGHSAIGITADVYSSFTKPMAAGAAARMDGLLKRKA